MGIGVSMQSDDVWAPSDTREQRGEGEEGCDVPNTTTMGTEAHAPSAPLLEYEDEEETFPALPAQSSSGASAHHGDRPPEAHARSPSPDDQGSVSAHVTASSAPGARAPSRVRGAGDAAPPQYLP